MSTLYIANCTRQTQQINYRLDINKDGVFAANKQPHKSLVVQSGKGAAIPGLHVSQCTHIIEQLQAVGGRDVVEKNRLPRHIVPYLLSTDKAISEKLIREVWNHNRGILAEGGEERRRRAAIASNQMVQSHVAETAEVQQFELEIEQQPDPDSPSEEAPLAQGFRVKADDKGRKGPAARR